MTVAALIPAAGEGRRLGRGPKALLALGDKTILAHSLAAFEGEVDELVIAVSEPMRTALPDLKGDLATPVRVISGGATRQATVFKLLEATDAETVLIHDAARPFLPRKVLEAVLKALKQHDAVTVTKSVADSLIHAETGETVERARLRAVQTPQGFRRSLLFEAHHRAREAQRCATDDAALVRALGHEVTQVEGSSWLFKITTPADYAVAQALVSVWDRDAA